MMIWDLACLTKKLKIKLLYTQILLIANNHVHSVSGHTMCDSPPPSPRNISPFIYRYKPSKTPYKVVLTQGHISLKSQ